jgi:hypothetical protein
MEKICILNWINPMYISMKTLIIAIGINGKMVNSIT